jgi:hypothetical protein
LIAAQSGLVPRLVAAKTRECAAIAARIGAARAMAQCPICKSAAEEIDRGFFDGVGFDCRRHGRFRVTGPVIKLMESNEWTRQAWESALMVAKRAAKLGDLPLIRSDYL